MLIAVVLYVVVARSHRRSGKAPAFAAAARPPPPHRPLPAPLPAPPRRLRRRRPPPTAARPPVDPLVASTAAVTSDLFRNHDLAFTSHSAGQHGGGQAHVRLQQRVLRVVQRVVAFSRKLQLATNMATSLTGPKHV
jgi:hypothetical protein